MPKYQCPTCETIYDSPLALSDLPICSKNGTHSPKSMKPTQEGTNQMSTTQTMKAQAKAEAKAPKPSKAKTPDKPCQCGAIPTDVPGVYDECGRLTRNEFAPGHDAKLKSALIACAVANISYKVGGLTQDPRTVAVGRGWAKFIDRAVEVASEKQAKRDAKAAEAKASRDAKASAKADRAEAAKAKALQKAADADAAKAAKAPAKPKAPAKASAPAKAPRARKAPAKAAVAAGGDW